MNNAFCKGRVKIHNLPADFAGTGTLEVELTNHSDQDWKMVDENPVFLCYHLLDQNWELVTYDGVRTALVPNGLGAGTTGIFTMQIRLPEKSGTYNLMLTLVRDGKYWFDSADDFRMETIKIQVDRDALPGPP